MIEREQAIRILEAITLQTLITLTPMTKTETQYKDKELLEELIKRLKQLV